MSKPNFGRILRGVFVLRLSESKHLFVQLTKIVIYSLFSLQVY